MFNDDRDEKIGKISHWIFFSLGVFYLIYPIYDIFAGHHIYRSIDGHWVNAIGPDHLIWNLPIIVLFFLVTGMTIRYFSTGDLCVFPWDE